MAPIKKAAAKKTTKTPRPKAEKPVVTATTPLEALNFSMEGKKVGVVVLPPELFNAPWRADLVHQVTTAMQANLRQNRAHTKDRSEVSGGGKKPWKQKGTGQARHGSSRSPIWRHGGITFGPRSTRDYSEKINKKMRVEALVSVLSRKAKDGEIIFVDKLAFNEPKTSTAKIFIEKLAKASEQSTLASKKKNAILFALSSHNANAQKSFRNMGQIATEEVRSLNPLAVLTHKYLVIENPDVSLKTLAARIK
jgi:large subunit ribosomal protein L4